MCLYFKCSDSIKVHLSNSISVFNIKGKMLFHLNIRLLFYNLSFQSHYGVAIGLQFSQNSLALYSPRFFHIPKQSQLACSKSCSASVSYLLRVLQTDLLTERYFRHSAFGIPRITTKIKDKTILTFIQQWIYSNVFLNICREYKKKVSSHLVLSRKVEGAKLKALLGAYHSPVCLIIGTGLANTVSLGFVS